jgi:hypothetical protein
VAVLGELEIQVLAEVQAVAVVMAILAELVLLGRLDKDMMADMDICGPAVEAEVLDLSVVRQGLERSAEQVAAQQHQASVDRQSIMPVAVVVEHIVPVIVVGPEG